MTEFNIVDGSVAVVLSEASPVALFKGRASNLWFYAPRAPRIAQDDSGRPKMVLARNRERIVGGGGLKSVGGVFAAQLDLTVPRLTLEQQNALAAEIRQATGMSPDGIGFKYQPLRLDKGRMSLDGISAYVQAGQKTSDIVVGASSTIGVSCSLNQLGADTFAAVLTAEGTPDVPMVVSLSYKYDMVLPRCHYKITAKADKVYDFFSDNTKARASWFGFGGASGNWSKVRENLLSSNAIKIEMTAPPEFVDDARIKQLEGSIIDAWTKSILPQILTRPSVDPAVAPDPGGWFGGVSYSMKKRSEVINLTLDAEYGLNSIIETEHSLTYVFGKQLSATNGDKSFVIDVTGDNELPIVINAVSDPLINRYQVQWGYRAQNGVVISDKLTNIDGKVGAVAVGVVQYPTNEEPPKEVDIKMSLDWAAPSWQDRTETFTAAVSESGAGLTYSPVANVFSAAVVSDLQRLPEGAISVFDWVAQHPTVGESLMQYKGTLIWAGAGAAGAPVKESIEFPIVAKARDDVRVNWTLAIVRPGKEDVQQTGTLKSGDPSLRLLLADKL